MGNETPRLKPAVPASPRQPIRIGADGADVLHARLGDTHSAASTAHGQECSPQREAAMNLRRNLLHLGESRWAQRRACNEAKSEPSSESLPSLDESHIESSQEQFHLDDSQPEQPDPETSQNPPRPESGTPSHLDQDVRPSSKRFSWASRSPLANKARQMQQPVHRPDYTDKKKGIYLKVWGVGLSAEGIATGASVAGGAVLGATAIASVSTLMSLGAWIGNLYDRYEASGSWDLSKKDYKDALTLLDKARAARVDLAKQLVAGGKLDEGKAYLDAAREMIVMANGLLTGHEAYLAPAEAELRAQRRELELLENDKFIEMIKNGKEDGLDENDKDTIEREAIIARIALMPDGKAARADALHDLKIKLGDLAAQLERINTVPNADAAAEKLSLQLGQVQQDIDRLERIARQKKYPALLRNNKHLGHKRVKRQRDETLTDIRLPPDIAATLTSFVGALLGIAALTVVGPVVTIALSPFGMRSAALDLEDARRERLAADASLKAVLNKLALAQSMQARFEGLPLDQQNDPQVRFGMSIARNLTTAALREYKQVMRLRRLAETKEFKGGGLRYVAIPALVCFAGTAIAGFALSIPTMGIAFGAMFAVTAIALGVYYVYTSKLKKEAKTDKHEGKRRQAAALWVRDKVGDVRTLFTSDSATAEAMIAQLRGMAPPSMRPYLNASSLLHNNEHLLSMALSEEYAHAPTDPAAEDRSNAPFAMQMTKPLGLSAARNNFLLHNDPLLERPQDKKDVALANLTSLFAGAKVYDADRLPYEAPVQATEADLDTAQQVLVQLNASDDPLARLIADHGSLEAIEAWVRQDPANARVMRKAVADLRAALISEHGIPATHLAELQHQLKSQDAPPAHLALVNVLVEWKDAALESTQDVKDISLPPVGIMQFEEALRQLGMTQKSGLQQKRLEKGRVLLAGGPIRTPRQWQKHFDKKPHEQDLQISNLVSIWRDLLPRNAQGEIEVPNGYANTDAYLEHLMRQTQLQYASLSDSVAKHDASETSKQFKPLQERFASNAYLAKLCAQQLLKDHPPAPRAERAAAGSLRLAPVSSRSAFAASWESGSAIAV